MWTESLDSTSFPQNWNISQSHRNKSYIFCYPENNLEKKPGELHGMSYASLCSICLNFPMGISFSKSLLLKLSFIGKFGKTIALHMFSQGQSDDCPDGLEIKLDMCLTSLSFSSSLGKQFSFLYKHWSHCDMLLPELQFVCK